ncbi:6-bladed beta-propeller [Algoriphagus sp. D3-2-R+10]|uniref:6-bladed beta-propeller n=1 Tax=Algoriphagus aurantiacus TaxID=3103948 RepID=UPI002B3644A4|nr:6-bladed beta-propeller [Algoriphagus sp. D3-2-R+10]MEB2776492.1 6-bladed beta-propeller [Algoriphagus sp. D3-2-R+10]
MRKTLFLIFVFSCSSPSENLMIYENETIELDFDSVSEIGDKVELSDLIKIKTVTKLNDESKFFITDIKKVERWIDYILILEKNKKVLVCFDSQGSFISTVGSKGEGPGQYIEVTDFTVDTNNKLIYIYSRSNRSIYVFDELLNFEKLISTNIFASYINLIDDGKIAFYMDMNHKRDDEFNIQVLDPKSGKVVGKKMKFPKEGEYFPFAYSGFLKNGLYSYPLSSEIYKIGSLDAPDSLFYIVNLENGLPKEKIFDHVGYLKIDFKEQKNILRDFSINEKDDKGFFSYNFDKSNKKFVSTAVRLKSGQLFNHDNLKSGIQGSWFSSLFFRPGVVPSFSRMNSLFYSWSYNESLKSIKIDQSINLGDLNDLKYLEPEDNPILIEFDLVDSYEK